MNQELEIPYEVPVMTLENTVLFPQAIMPLYIFEPRYRQMLSEVLAGDRIFAVAAVDDGVFPDDHCDDPPCTVASVGIVRACRTNEDGTSNLVLQGLARVALDEITEEEPFRKALIRQIISEPGGSEASLASIKPKILKHVEAQIELGAPIPKEVLQFLGSVGDPEAILDLAIYTLCASGELKQELLETNEVVQRFDRFDEYLQSEIQRLEFERDLRGGLGDESLGSN